MSQRKKRRIPVRKGTDSDKAHCTIDLFIKTIDFPIKKTIDLSFKSIDLSFKSIDLSIINIDPVFCMLIELSIHRLSPGNSENYQFIDIEP
jgi:hypothetical protein